MARTCPVRVLHHPPCRVSAVQRASSYLLRLQVLFCRRVPCACPSVYFRSLFPGPHSAPSSPTRAYNPPCSRLQYPAPAFPIFFSVKHQPVFQMTMHAISVHVLAMQLPPRSFRGLDTEALALPPILPTIVLPGSYQRCTCIASHNDHSPQGTDAARCCDHQ